jgi:tetratricopeptide (TPR) repeat protein
MSLDRAVALQAKAWGLQQSGDLEAAAQALREAVSIASQSSDEAALDLANLLSDSAEVEYECGAYRACLDYAQRALALIERASPDDGNGETVARICIHALDLSAGAQRAIGQYTEAEASLLQAIDVATARFGHDSFEAAQVRNALGIVYKFSGRWDEGLRVYDEVLRGTLVRDGEMSDAAAAVYHNIGGLWHARGEFVRAEPPARLAWEIARALRGDDDVETTRHAVAYAGVLDGLERHAESLAVYDRALTVFEAWYGPNHPEVGATLHNRAGAFARLGAHRNAEHDYRRALAIEENTAGVDAPDTALTRQGLGRLLCEMGRSDEGVPLLQSALIDLRARLPEEHPYVTAARESLAAGLSSGHSPAIPAALQKTPTVT